MINASPSNPRFFNNGSRKFVMIAVSIVVGALLALPLFIGSAAVSTESIDKSAVKVNFDNSMPARPKRRASKFQSTSANPAEWSSDGRNICV